jgi:1,2-diacylglycerol 3-beta-glucosyltransferase
VVHIILAVVLALPTAYLVAVSAYLFAITLAAYTYRARRVPPETPIRFAVVIPAHNEELQIGALLDDTAAFDYPEDCYHVFVIADNCTDRTAELVREAGATAAERTNPDLRGKGYALDWFIKEYDTTLAEYDAITIIDADMHVNAVFLKELAASLGDPEVQVVQSLNAVAKPEKNWRSAFGFAGFALINHVRPSGRARLGGTSELRGSGMAFRTAVLRERGWPTHSLAEDVEFSKQLLLDGICVRYVPGAMVTSEFPTHTSQAAVQQQRWEGGRFHVLKQYLPVFAHKALVERKWRYIDAVLDLLVPPLSILVLLAGVLAVLGFVVHPLWGLAIAGCLAAVAFCVVSALILAHAPLRVWLYLSTAPLYVLWKLPVYAWLLMNRAPIAWRRTPRDDEVESGK